MVTFEWIIALLLGAAAAGRAGAIASARRTRPSSRSAASRSRSCRPARTGRSTRSSRSTLFVAPVLLDAAYDTSLRDLRAQLAAGRRAGRRRGRHDGRRGGARRALAGARHAVARRDRARRHRRAARRRGGDGRDAPGEAAAPAAQDPRGREPAQRRERAAGLPARDHGGDGRPLGLASSRRCSCSPPSAASSRASRCAWLLVPLSARSREVPVQLIVQFSIAFGVWIAAEAIGAVGHPDDGRVRDDASRAAAACRCRRACACRSSRCGSRRCSCSTRSPSC